MNNSNCKEDYRTCTHSSLQALTESQSSDAEETTEASEDEHAATPAVSGEPDQLFYIDTGADKSMAELVKVGS